MISSYTIGYLCMYAFMHLTSNQSTFSNALGQTRVWWTRVCIEPESTIAWRILPWLVKGMLQSILKSLARVTVESRPGAVDQLYSWCTDGSSATIWANTLDDEATRSATRGFWRHCDTIKDPHTQRYRLSVFIFRLSLRQLTCCPPTASHHVQFCVLVQHTQMGRCD